MSVVLNTIRTDNSGKEASSFDVYRIGNTVRSLAQFLEVKQRQRGRITPSRLYASPNAFDAVRNASVLRQATVCKACVKEKEWVSVHLCKTPGKGTGNER